MKRIYTVLIVLFLMAACSSEPKINLQDIHRIFADNGMQLLEEDKHTKFFVLNGTKSTAYKLDNGESLSFYLFNSEKKRKKGLDDFHKQKAKYDMQIPAIYEAGNVLIFYWYHGETGSKTNYDSAIQHAVLSLRVTK